MRRIGSPVLLALLAACTVTTTGAPCSSDLNCPSDQGCGSDRACSTAALSCPGHTEEGQCSPGTACVSGQLVTCTAGSGVCSTRSVEPCSDPGATCTQTGTGVACACPAADACTDLDATRCSAGADAVQRCRPVATGSACLTWQTEQSCASGGLVCSASACACPANTGTTFVADAVGGTPAGADPLPTGLLVPVACRYQTLTGALAAARARGAGSTVLAAGWSAGVPGGAVLFTEPGGLSVPAGVTLTTDDPTPTTGHYAITTGSALAGPLVEIGAGGTMTGFEIRNAASSGDGVAIACATPADTLPVSLTAVRIAAASGGSPVARLVAGIRVSGYCGASLADVTVDGAATGILVDAAAPGIGSTASTPRVTGSTVAGLSVVEGTLAVTGGTVEGNAAGALVGVSGTGAPTFSATGTTFSGNAGDAVFVARGTIVTDGCPYVNNGTHVHAQPAGGAAVNVTVQNSAGAARMTGATNSAFRLLAMGSGSTLVLRGNSVSGMERRRTTTSQRGRGGVAVSFSRPRSPVLSLFAATSSSGTRGTRCSWRRGTGALDLSWRCRLAARRSNTFGCFDTSNASVGVYSNGAAVAADWNHWTEQPAVYASRLRRGRSNRVRHWRLLRRRTRLPLIFSRGVVYAAPRHSPFSPRDIHVTRPG